MSLPGAVSVSEQNGQLHNAASHGPDRGAVLHEPSSTTVLPTRETEAWNWRSIRFGYILANLPWLTFIVHVAAVVSAGVVYASKVAPTQRYFLLSDPTISYPEVTQTIPAVAAVVTGIAMLFLTILVTELVLISKFHSNVTAAVYSTAYFFLDGLSSFMITCVAQIFTTLATGVLRPNFIANCNPDAQGLCQNNDNKVHNAQKSFFSGHSAFTINFTTYASFYLLWSLYHRTPQVAFSNKTAASSRTRWLNELKHTFVMGWISGMLTFAWVTVCSRITNYEHSPADVTAGALVGVFFSLMYLFRATGLLAGLPTNPSHEEVSRSELSSQVNSAHLPPIKFDSGSMVATSVAGPGAESV